MRALPLLLLGLLLLGCAMSRSAAAVRIETLDDARALLTDRRRDRWDAAEDPEKTRWQEGLELIESLRAELQRARASPSVTPRSRQAA